MARMIWGLSKSDANYHTAPRPEVRCAVCKYMFPKFSIGGCRWVRGAIRAGDTCNEFAPSRSHLGQGGSPGG